MQWFFEKKMAKWTVWDNFALSFRLNSLLSVRKTLHVENSPCRPRSHKRTIGFNPTIQPNSIFWHTSEVSFDRKCIKIIDILILIIENWTVFFVFCYATNIRKNRVKMSTWVNFRIKVMKKWYARKLIHWNLSFITFYSTQCEFENILIHICIIKHSRVL